jgi:NAD-dependent DNA ligase
MHWLEREVLIHRFNYYCLDDPIISDSEYDALERKALAELPDSKILNSVGSSLRSSYPQEILDMFE